VLYQEVSFSRLKILCRQGELTFYACLAESKNEHFKSSQGLEASEEEMRDAFDDVDDSLLDDGEATPTDPSEAS
jgi:hypothetical protein